MKHTLAGVVCARQFLHLSSDCKLQVFQGMVAQFNDFDKSLQEVNSSLETFVWRGSSQDGRRSSLCFCILKCRQCPLPFG